MPRENVEYEHKRIAVSDLVPYARNARLHSDTQVTQLAGSIRMFGFTNPILIDEAGGIIAGHGRVMAARKLKMQMVPCMVIAGLSEAERRALVIADNKLSLNATWNNDLLVQELGDIASDGIDLSIVGFAPGEMDALLGVNVDFSPGDADDQGRLDERSPVKCPECGHLFVPGPKPAA